MREFVAGYALGSRDLATWDDTLEAFVSDYRQLVEVIESHRELLDIIGDRAINVAARVGVISDLFSSRVNRWALSLAEAVALHETPGEVAETLPLTASVVESSYVLAEPGGYVTERRVLGYAGALVDSCTSEELRDLSRSLRRVSEVFTANKELTRAISGNQPESVRSGVIHDLFSARTDPKTYAILRVIGALPAVRSVTDLLDTIDVHVAGRLDEIVAVVATASEVDEGVRDRVMTSLEHKAGRHLDVAWQVSPDLIGGVRAVIGDLVFDTTVKRSLERVGHLLGATKREKE